MLNLAQPRKARRPGLTPMIDVVFLLLVFFMLAARFGINPSQPLQGAGGVTVLAGAAPRLVDIAADGLRLNGITISAPALMARLRVLETGEQSLVVLRPAAGVDVQRLSDVITRLREAGFNDLALVE